MKIILITFLLMASAINSNSVATKMDVDCGCDTTSLPMGYDTTAIKLLADKVIDEMGDRVVNNLDSFKVILNQEMARKKLKVLIVDEDKRVNGDEYAWNWYFYVSRRDTAYAFTRPVKIK